MSSALTSLALVFILWLGLTAVCSRSSPQSYDATYEVSGTGIGLANITYSNQDGGTQQKEVGLKWSESFKVRPGAFLYLSAQTTASGSITSRILINGQVRKTATSSGQYTIATSSYRCCD